MPMMVQHSKIPFSRAVSANGMPLMNIQNTLAIKEIVLPPYCTSLPKGQKAKEASLKHCLPMGIPIMVMHHRIPASTQERPCHSPQHRNQMIFPKHPIYFTSRFTLCMACVFCTQALIIFIITHAATMHKVNAQSRQNRRYKGNYYGAVQVRTSLSVRTNVPDTLH